MSDCLVVGMPNVGKTSFVLNFAEYMGLKKIKLYVKQPAGYTSIRDYSINKARDELISTESNFTREIQAVKLSIPAGKVDRELKIIDSCGLREGIHPDAEIRMAMAYTIRHLQESKFILHIIDLTNIRTDQNKDVLQPIDRMIFDYASKDLNYAILVNKVDLVQFKNRLLYLKEQIKYKMIFPISALYQQGFKEVKMLVLSNV